MQTSLNKCKLNLIYYLYLFITLSADAQCRTPNYKTFNYLYTDFIVWHTYCGIVNSYNIIS